VSTPRTPDGTSWRAFYDQVGSSAGMAPEEDEPLTSFTGLSGFNKASLDALSSPFPLFWFDRGEEELHASAQGALYPFPRA